MATNFTQFTSEATPSGDVVLVGHNIAGTGEIKTTISQILSAMNLATSSDATFNKVTVTTDIDLSDGSAINVGGSTGNLTANLADLHFELTGGTGFLRNSVAFGTLYLGANGTTSTWGGRIQMGASTTLGAGVGVTLVGRRNGSFEVSADSMSIDCDLSLDSNLNLTDGSTITVGGGSGTVTVDGELDVDEDIILASAKSLHFDGNGNSTTYSIKKGGSRLEFRTTQTNSMFVVGDHMINVRGDARFGFATSDPAATPDVAFSRAAAGHIQLGNGTLNDTSGTLELSDIIVSDGSTITVGGGSGFVDLDGAISLNEGASVATGKPIVFNGGTTLDSTAGYSIVRGGARLEFRTTSPTPFFVVSSHTAVIGATSTLSFSSVASAAGTPDAAFSRGAAGHIQLGNGTLNDTSGKLELADIVASANIDFTGLPTSDPASAGRLYVDSSAGHVIKVSQG